MSIVKIRTNRQVTIPKAIFDETGLQEGDFVEVIWNQDHIVIKPKKLVDADDLLTPEEEEQVRKGEVQLERGEFVNWKDVKESLEL